MITGIVNQKLEATIPVTVLGPAGQLLQVQAVIDTGYNGFMTLPLALITSLALVKGAAREVTLGDTSSRVFDFYTAEVLWDDKQLKVRVLCVEGDALIGTALLASYRLEVDFIAGGLVTIKPQQ